MRGETVYQTVLIALGVVASIFFGVFLYRELFPEYKIYQDAYIELEKIRSQYTGDPVPFFKSGVKQIVIPASDNGPEVIDRCVSCHVALELEHFSPTKVALDINGNVVKDLEGKPVLEPNENYIWGYVDPNNESLRIAKVGEYEYDMTKVLAMHPLMGNETRPFEFHPVAVYGCTSCHSGNGRGLVTDRAHGPVFDEMYEPDHIVNKPEFLERDKRNEPRFASAYNDKPGHRLLFQTTPLLIGDVIQANCVQCHRDTPGQISQAVTQLQKVTNDKNDRLNALREALLNEQAAVIELIDAKREIANNGVDAYLKGINQSRQDYRLPQEKLNQLTGQYNYISKQDKEAVPKEIEKDLLKILGSKEAVAKFEKKIEEGKTTPESLTEFVQQQIDEGYVKGSLFSKAIKLKETSQALELIQNAGTPLLDATTDKSLISPLKGSIDKLTQGYQRGKDLYISQACYACHRISGLARGGVGPELSWIGHGYPWFIKESMVWPQADLKTSVMPNIRLDHEELEDLMAFLMAQRIESPAVSDVDKRVRTKAWEEGAKVWFEQPLSPAETYDLNRSMTIFAHEGCASCHRLKGYTSDVGFTIEKQGTTPEKVKQEKEWFRKLFPNQILGSRIVETIEKHQKEIQKRISPDVRKKSLLEKIEAEHPHLIESFYSNFKFALRAKNYTKDPKTIEKWQEQVRHILMLYIQEYGLGRQIGPDVSWSGIYRSDQWLMEHFWNPQSHSAKSIMPAFPFDNTKFLALTHMLNELALKNRSELRQRWEERGFNPQEAYDAVCLQCHGPFMQGNGPVAEWIYPIPKNLKNAIFLRNQTKSMVYQSIKHGIKGGPMAPWGEVGADKREEGFQQVLSDDEIREMVNWIFRDLELYERDQEDIQKWRYSPEDVLEELQNEGDTKKIKEENALSILSPSEENYLAQVDPWQSIPKKGDTADPWKPEEGYPKPLEVSEVFDVVKEGEYDRAPGYYIKRQYYTEKNIQEGEEYFLLNCSICHGREGDGAGLRAGTMQEAKPRMLTNLDWIETRDDLRLLRSIKYGVAGTSMTPWGDATTSLQRLQLVMYIRSLSWQQKIQENVTNAVYNAFDTSKWAIEMFRSQQLENLAELRNQLDSLNKERERVALEAQRGKADPQEAASLFAKELQIKASIQSQQNTDEQLHKMQKALTQQREIFLRAGSSIISRYRGIDNPILDAWLKIIELSGKNFDFQNKTLVMVALEEKNIEKYKSIIFQTIDEELNQLNREKTKTESRLPSIEREKKLQKLDQEIGGLTTLKNTIVATLAESQRLTQTERTLYQEVMNNTGEST
ncbi:MAG: hypothetical protein Tsb0021_02790 [Chlamydiales bacterium]